MQIAGNYRNPDSKIYSSIKVDDSWNKFHLLLSWLSPDKEEAAQIYELIRWRLIRVFRSRQCFRAEELADETIERVTNNIDCLTKTYKGDPLRYFLGVGKNVLLEYFREPRMVELPKTLEQTNCSKEVKILEQESYRLSKCLEKLTTAERNLILRYYQTKNRQKDRKILAEELEISPVNLRVQAYRIRKKLQKLYFKKPKNFDKN